MNNKYKALSCPRGLLPLFAALLALCLFAPVAMAEDDPKGIMEVDLSPKPAPLDETVEKGISHLFKVLDDKTVPLSVAEIAPMLDFVIGVDADPKDIEPAKRFNGRGICLRRDVKTDLAHILKYFYNPDIPNYLLCPAVLRMSGWHQGSEFLNRSSGLWEELPNLDRPVITRGREFEVTTPDSFAEAYYGYNLNRLMILLKHNGKNVLISVSRQEDKSEVGRKGAILDDRQWDYFYSGLEGLNRGMIGWMDTFTYASGSVQVFAEQDADAPRSTVFLFKWLRAGWAGMNVVQRSHIYDGTLRYVRSFSKVVESKDLTPEFLVNGLKTVLNMPESRMNTLINEYARNFEARFKNDPKLQDSDYAKVIRDGGYAEVLDANARRSVLALEKLKSMLGMETLVTLDETPRPQPVAETASPVGEQVAEREVLPGS
ncbi:hypothetical protein [Pseudodesulfovibrio indicus]|uniref:Uncharacterized protein n=1 Tax=Pseudodesulfovibrio indicus TaxID=1716143 RepID=A0A126QL27_9BACT|nr:hypothetical protein [Pseudodesulfovibrio indicus]AMK10476.1 hypothetical protein AWY79_04765 [Pseudodesulfovibrio indicus]TDT89126.1 hypothetical protein EDC59_104119 [Pseudodesulfovibrio indicus]